METEEKEEKSLPPEVATIAVSKVSLIKQMTCNINPPL